MLQSGTRTSLAFDKGATVRYTFVANDIGVVQGIMLYSVPIAPSKAEKASDDDPAVDKSTKNDAAVNKPAKKAGSAARPSATAPNAAGGGTADQLHVKKVEVKCPRAGDVKAVKAAIFTIDAWVGEAGIKATVGGAVGEADPLDLKALTKRRGSVVLVAGGASAENSKQVVSSDPRWAAISDRVIRTLNRHLSEFRVARSIENAYSKIFKRGTIVPFNPHPQILDGFMKRTVSEDLSATPSSRMLFRKAFPSGTAHIRESESRRTRGGMTCSVHYTMVVDVAGNHAFANPAFPMTVDLQACAFYRTVYEEILSNVIDRRSGIHTWGTFSTDGASCLAGKMAPFRPTPQIAICFYMQSEFTRRMEHILEAHVERFIGCGRRPSSERLSRVDTLLCSQQVPGDEPHTSRAAVGIILCCQWKRRGHPASRAK